MGWWAVGRPPHLHLSLSPLPAYTHHILQRPRRDGQHDGHDGGWGVGWARSARARRPARPLFNPDHRSSAHPSRERAPQVAC